MRVFKGTPKELIEWGAKEEDEMDEIEKIKKYLNTLEANTDWEVSNSIYRKDIQTLLAFLKKEKEKVKELSDEKLNRHDEVMMWVEKCNQAESRLKNLKDMILNV